MGEHVALVTGSSSGFGMLAVVELAKNGFHVIATMRDLSKKGKVQELLIENNLTDMVRFEQLDVTDTDSIHRISLVIHSIGRVDVLVNNAGYAAGGFAEEVSMEEFRKQFDTNFFGLVEVTQAVLPFMRQQSYGKIINISSISGLIGFPGLSPYVSSKYALEGFSESLRLEVKPFGIDVFLVEPGSYRTKIWSSGKKISDRSLQSNSPYYSYMEKIVGEMENGKKHHQEPLSVVYLICKLANGEYSHKLRHPIGKGVKQGIILKTIISWKMWENTVLKKLGFR